MFCIFLIGDQYGGVSILGVFFIFTIISLHYKHMEDNEMVIFGECQIVIRRMIDYKSLQVLHKNSSKNQMQVGSIT